MISNQVFIFAAFFLKKVKSDDSKKPFGIKEFTNALCTVMPNIKDWNGARKNRKSKAAKNDITNDVQPIAD